MKEELYIINKVGRQNPFRVPEGYFEGLANQVMSQIDTEAGSQTDAALESQAVVEALPLADANPAPQARVYRLRRWGYAAAASVCALLVAGAAYLSPFGTRLDTSARPLSAEVVTHQADDDAFDEAADYVMVDNQEIYACLSSDY